MKRGFTLIETIVYLALFSILMGGAVVAAFNIFENAGRQETRTMLEEEGAFLMAKIDWAVSNATFVNQPIGYGPLLWVTTGSGLVIINLPVASTSIVIQDGVVGPYALNNSNVSVTRLSFLHTLASGNGINPESVSASTTLTAKTPTGALISEDFSTVMYLHH